MEFTIQIKKAIAQDVIIESEDERSAIQLITNQLYKDNVMIKHETVFSAHIITQEEYIGQTDYVQFVQEFK